MQFVKRYWRIIFPIVIAVIIWNFSSQTGDISDQQSLFWAQFFGLTNMVTRKLAHIVLFGLFGYSVTSFTKGLYPDFFPNYSLVIYPVIIATVYGAIDEVHQLTVMGRDAAIGDVFIDTLAGLAGVLAYVAIFCFWRRWRMYRAYVRATSTR
jgi:VanZ family protein